MTTVEIKTNLKKLCEARGIPSMDDIVYETEVKDAISEINRCRRFKPSDSKLYDEKYEDLIIPLAISSIAKYGAEGQTSHTENGVSRGYGSDGRYPKSILSSIKPLIK